MKDKKNVVAVILARGGSKGLPQKNIALLSGKPLIQYTVDPLKKAKLVDRIIVSTDDEEIGSVSRAIGAEVPFIRPKALAEDHTTTEDALKHALVWLSEKEGYRADILVFLQITDLFKRAEWIDQAVKMLLEDDLLDSVFVGCPSHKNYWKKETDHFTRLTKECYGPRQLKEHIYREDTGLGCATRASLITEKSRRLGDNVKIITNDDFTVDVHSEFDLWLAEKLLRERPEFKRYRIK